MKQYIYHKPNTGKKRQKVYSPVDSADLEGLIYLSGRAVEL
jgi:hypothetical protein